MPSLGMKHQTTSFETATRPMAKPSPGVLRPWASAITLAERARGETDRLDPQGVPRSYRRLRRGPSAPDPFGLHRLLQRMPNTSVLGQRFAGPSADPPARPACCSADPWRTSSSVLSDLVSGRHKGPRNA